MRSPLVQTGIHPGRSSNIGWSSSAVALANPSSGVTKLEEFADRPVCFVNPTSTSGFAVPMGGLLEAGVNVSVENRFFGDAHELNEFLTDGWFGFGAVDDSYYDLIRTLCTEIADEVEACQA